MKSQSDIEYALIGLVMRNTVGVDERKSIADLIAHQPVRWERFLQLLEYHEFAPFTHLSFKDVTKLIPETVKKICTKTYYYHLGRNLMMKQEFMRIADAFVNLGIAIVPIKGMALLEDIYAQHPVRPMADIDVLVKEEDMPGVGLTLEELGYIETSEGLSKEYWDKTKCQRVFRKPQVSPPLLVEVHSNFDYWRRENSIRFDAWKRIRYIQQGQSEMKMLSPEDTLFSIVLHQRGFGKCLCLKYAVDAALLLDKYEDTFDWGYVVKQAYRHRIRLSIFFLLTMLQQNSMCRVPGDVIEALRVPLYKKKIVSFFIKEYVISVGTIREGQKTIYLKLHFLLSDSWIQALVYILRVSKEHFALFFGLNLYDRKTDFLYKNRFIYYVWKTICLFVYKDFITSRQRRGYTTSV